MSTYFFSKKTVLKEIVKKQKFDLKRRMRRNYGGLEFREDTRKCTEHTTPSIYDVDTKGITC